MTLRLLLLLLSLPLVALQAQEPSSPAGCDPIASDSARFGTTPVFAACEVDRAARFQRSSRVSSTLFPDGVYCMIAELEFVVDERGTPIATTAKLLFASTPEFGAAVRNSLSRWRYAPAQRQGTAVRQLVIGRLAQSEMGVTERKVPFTVVTVTGPGEPRPGPLPGSQMPRGQPAQESATPCK